MKPSSEGASALRQWSSWLPANPAHQSVSVADALGHARARLSQNLAELGLPTDWRELLAMHDTNSPDVKTITVVSKLVPPAGATARRRKGPVPQIPAAIAADFGRVRHVHPCKPHGYFYANTAVKTQQELLRQSAECLWAIDKEMAAPTQNDGVRLYRIGLMLTDLGVQIAAVHDGRKALQRRTIRDKNARLFVLSRDAWIRWRRVPKNRGREPTAAEMFKELANGAAVVDLPSDQVQWVDAKGVQQTTTFRRYSTLLTGWWNKF